MRPFLRDEKGTVILLVALGMTVFLGLLALVIDGGQLYFEKSKLQKAVDAAVLAGAQDLPTRNDKARQEANKTAQFNGLAEDDEIDVTFGDANTTITVKATRKIELTFAKVLGISSAEVVASAKGVLRPLTSAKWVIPLGVESSLSYEYGEEVELKHDDSENGNFGILDFTGGGGGADEFGDYFAHGFPTDIKVGQIIDTERGGKTGKARDGLDYRLNACPYATFEDYESDCSRIVIVPMYTIINKFSVRIDGFASFFLEDVNSDGKLITGRFIQTVQSGSISDSQENYGSYGLKLVE